jgi:acyl-CoA thioester hydrolase
MQADALEPLHRTIIRPGWLDYNGHLNEAYYLLVFSHATDALIDLIGMDDAWRRANGMTVYTLETHIRYLQEVGAGAEVQVDSRVLGLDAKRLRLFHRMKRSDDAATLATAEMLLVNIDTSGDASGPRSAPWAAPVRERLDRLQELHAHQALPDGAGRSISLDRPKKSHAAS